MRVPDEKTKGFNILELIVVLLIIGIVSALGYPEITKWRKDREVKSFAIATKTLIEGIVAQVQRGQYAFVQVRVDEEQVDVEGSTDRVLTITSKGMKPETLTNFLNDPASAWNR
jgi:prepilin-type N-terminal cleavage/methylation domain-containing protein